MASRGNFAALLAPGLNSIFFDQLKVIPLEHTKWCNTKTSKRAYEEEHKVAGLGFMLQKGEGEVYSFDEPLNGDTIRYTHLTYGLAMRVTKEMMEDDLYGIMNRMSSELGKAAAYNKDVQATTILNNAFNSSFTGLNGTELCSTAQPMLGGGTQSNHSATNIDLGMAALQAAIEQFKTWTDDRGYRTIHEPQHLVHNTGDIWSSHELLETEKVPNSNDNTINVVKSKFGITPMYLRHLTDQNAWFLLANKADHDMKQWMRIGDQFNHSDDPLNGDSIHTSRHRLSNGFGDYRGVWGSPGQ